MSSKIFKSNLRFCLFVFLIVTAYTTAFAWGAEGHRITVRIATNYLTPAARTAVILLLMTDIANNTVYYQKKCPGVLTLSTKAKLTPVDEIKLVNDGLACIATRERSYTSNWHFVDIPIILATSATPTLFSYDASRDCRTNPKKGDCAILALERLAPVITNYKDPKATSGHLYGEELTSRAEALKFFIHIVGDIHQPLHCSNDQKNIDDNGDIGGNNKQASWFEETKTDFGPMNVHTIWDDGFIGRTMKTNNWSEVDYAKKLIDSIPSTSPERTAIEKGDYSDWVGESYNLAVKNAYGKLPAYDNTCKLPYIDQDTHQPAIATGCYTLGQAYYDVNNPVIEQQLKSGGVRLAKLLNSLFP